MQQLWWAPHKVAVCCFLLTARIPFSPHCSWSMRHPTAFASKGKNACSLTAARFEGLQALMAPELCHAFLKHPQAGAVLCCAMLR